MPTVQQKNSYCIKLDGTDLQLFRYKDKDYIGLLNFLITLGYPNSKEMEQRSRRCQYMSVKNSKDLAVKSQLWEYAVEYFEGSKLSEDQKNQIIGAVEYVFRKMKNGESIRMVNTTLYVDRAPKIKIRFNMFEGTSKEFLLIKRNDEYFISIADLRILLGYSRPSMLRQINKEAKKWFCLNGKNEIYVSLKEAAIVNKKCNSFCKGRCDLFLKTAQDQIRQFESAPDSDFS